MKGPSEEPAVFVRQQSSTALDTVAAAKNLPLPIQITPVAERFLKVILACCTLVFPHTHPSLQAGLPSPVHDPSS